MSLLFLLIGVPAWFICHKWIGLNELTSLSIIIAVFLTFCAVIDVVTSKNARERIGKSYKCQAIILSKHKVHGYKGRTTYMVELHPEFEKIVLEKNNLYKDYQVNDTFDAYPIYDKDHNIIDFDYDTDMQKSLTKPVYFAAVLTALLSIFLIVNDGDKLLHQISNIVSGVLLSAFLLFISIIGIRRYIISRNRRLLPVKAVIHSIVRVSRYNDGIDMSYIYPIYQAVINGEVYQFSGSEKIEENDKGKEVTAYYDQNTMEFYEATDLKSDKDLIIAILMFALAVALLFNAFK